MATIRRRIDGPQDFHEQKGGLAFRDTRSVPHQIAEILRSGFSSIGLVAIAGVAVTVPALTTAIVPLAVAYAGYVLTRPVTLPLRLPANAKERTTAILSRTQNDLASKSRASLLETG